MVITKHAKKRLKQRVTRNKKVGEKSAHRALVCGYQLHETKGPLAAWMSEVSTNSCNGDTLRVYGDKLYIFTDDVLVTVLSLPSRIVCKFDQYLKPNAKEKHQKMLEAFLRGELRYEGKTAASNIPAREEIPVVRKKQVIVMRSDIDMNRGQISAQAANACTRLMEKIAGDHGTVEKIGEMFKELQKASRILLEVDSQDALLHVFRKAEDNGISGVVQYGSGPMTDNKAVPVCFALYPATEGELAGITGMLPLFN